MKLIDVESPMLIIPASDFPWSGMPSPIVDIGGGIGSLEDTLLLLPENRRLTFQVLDLKDTVEHAKKVCHGMQFVCLFGFNLP